MRFGIVALFPLLVAGIRPPSLKGMKLMWSDDFEGPAGSSPNSKEWNIVTDIHVNNEVETYTVLNDNVQISGGGTIQFVPRKSLLGQWTSGRIESKPSWTPKAGKIMTASASIRLGSNGAASKKGIWPAFWLLGDSIRHGTSWPKCGEIDIFEQVNGLATGHGTLHCGTAQGGPCHETNGRSGSVSMPLNGFHTWSVEINLTKSDWRSQTISFQLDGKTFFTVSGANINDGPVWSTLAHSPMYMIFNVAVGGNWPGAPNAATLDGYGSMMEVQWAAVYSS
ncbi:glycoside hydrolase family 16 protein [Xylaria intraflava]|nr:glycoside hydrolase family 16 protein [Xylaria intraflava]